ncbi:MAG: DNA repair exonuclease, partial [Dehalococcoidia bacterium]
MKILHTADWHIGKKLKGIDRIQEYEDVLEEIINIAITESVDCIIISGDIFDSYTPSTDAEKLFWNIIIKIRKNNIELILLAGNHDSPKKIEAMQPSLEKHGVQVYARFDDNDLAKNIATIEKNNEKLQIAVIPWINESFLTKNLETFLETSKQEQGKQYGIILETIYRDIIELLDKDAIHILATHTLINEALIQEANQEKDISERRITLDKVTYGISSSQLPKQINYIALGHIHQPQEIIHNAPTHYAGSVLQLSFA